MNAQLEALLTRTNSKFHFNTEEGTCCLFGIDKNGNNRRDKLLQLS